MKIFLYFIKVYPISPVMEVYIWRGDIQLNVLYMVFLEEANLKM